MRNRKENRSIVRFTIRRMNDSNKNHADSKDRVQQLVWIESWTKLTHSESDEQTDDFLPAA